MNFYSIFFIKNELLTENVKKWVCDNELNGRTVQPLTVETYINLSGIVCSTKTIESFFFRILF